MNQEEAEKAFKDMLDEIYPVYVIGDLSFNPSDILKDCDPIAYLCGLVDYLDAEGIEVQA